MEKKCSKCGKVKPTSEFSPKRGECKKCKCAYRAQHAKENPEKIKEAVNKWRARNPEAVSAMEKRTREKHKDKRNAATAQWRKNNPDKAKAIVASWREKHPGASTTYSKARRANLRNNDGAVRSVNRYAVLRAAQYKCGICGVDISDSFEVDHKIPVSRGGRTEDSNLHAVCPSCNRRKGRKTLDEYLCSGGTHA